MTIGNRRDVMKNSFFDAFISGRVVVGDKNEILAGSKDNNSSCSDRFRNTPCQHGSKNTKFPDQREAATAERIYVIFICKFLYMIRVYEISLMKYLYDYRVSFFSSVIVNNVNVHAAAV